MVGTVELSSAAFCFMLFGDFLGLVFVFLCLFWTLDNYCSCKSQEKMGHMGRRSSAMVRSIVKRHSDDENIPSRWSLRRKSSSFFRKSGRRSSSYDSGVGVSNVSQTSSTRRAVRRIVYQKSAAF